MITLILAGGRSERMGRDKTQIVRPDGNRQIDYLIQIARDVTSHVVVSTNTLVGVEGVELLADENPGSGPLEALRTAHHRFPDAPLLVIGCDLFLLDIETLEALLAGRSENHLATCFLNRIDSRPEPLCAIFEPASLDQVPDNHCARRFLESLGPKLLTLPKSTALDNANTPTDLEEVFAKLTHPTTYKSVSILYFAKLKELRGLDQETISTVSVTAGGLYEELSFKHRLKLPIETLRCAINGDFVPWSSRIAENDEVVFIPPVAGG